MSNLYWPIYKNIEKEALELSNLVHFDDSQMAVYSVKISELLIRCSVEIESISKDLYIEDGGTVPTDRDLYFDTDCLKHLEEKWLLSKKVLVLSSSNFHYKDEKNKTLKPLHKAHKRGTSGSDWKKAYQAVKHERVKSLAKGNIGNLLRALGALFILNIYFKRETFELGKDSKATIFPINCGSELFSIKIHNWSGADGNGVYQKREDFDESIYYVNWTQETGKEFQESMSNFNSHMQNLIFKHPKVLKYISENDISNYEGNLAWDVLGQQEYVSILQRSQSAVPIKGDKLEYEAKLNINSI
ncbi:hypothetical protein [Psychromonas aquimarina]|uniref:hypothetical protein n=1 Tax=Psychromonas aquimarina TaxID=444919 RepID=UPI00048D6DE9|nr:hypothetical protein [Psychromonas aquimarina]